MRMIDEAEYERLIAAEKVACELSAIVLVRGTIELNIAPPLLDLLEQWERMDKKR